MLPDLSVNEETFTLVIREMQIKTTLKFHFTPIRMVKINLKKVIDHAGNDVAQGEHLCIVDGSANLYSHYGYQCDNTSGRWEPIYLKIQLYYSWAYLTIVSSDHGKTCSTMFCCLFLLFLRGPATQLPNKFTHQGLLLLMNVQP